MASDLANKIFTSSELNSDLNKLQIQNQVLFDKIALPRNSYIASLFENKTIPETEVNKTKVRVGGYFFLGKSFATYGNIITSDSTFLRLFANHESNQIGTGLIKLKAGADIKKVKNNLKLGLPDDVLVLTHQEYIDMERNYWGKTTPIGFMFGVGVMVSFIVGCVIVYQILYSDISAHLAEYAMLKAIGYTNKYLLSVLGQETLLLAVLGYIPGIITALGFYKLASNTTKLPVFMTLERGASVFVLTVMMCFISGIIAMQKLRTADPADLM